MTAAQPLTSRSPIASPLRLLVACQQRREPCVLVTVVGIQGAAPRRIGAQMTIAASGEVAGSLSGGCLDAAVIAEAHAVLAARISKRLRYGADSDYVDIVMPCGSGLDLQFDGALATDTVTAIATALAKRQPVRLYWMDADTPAQFQFLDANAPDAAVRIEHAPDLRLVLAGAGETLWAMGKLARAADIEVIALSPEREVLDQLSGQQVMTHWLQTQSNLPPIGFDAYTAALTLFHDHEWELPFLRAALASDALLIAAMGSPRAHALRLDSLRAQAVDEARLARLRGPFGLLPRARDPRELAISMLAEIMQVYRARCFPDTP